MKILDPEVAAKLSMQERLRIENQQQQTNISDFFFVKK